MTSEEDIRAMILSRHFDIVVYPRTVHKKPITEKPFFRDVTTAYGRNQVAFVDGNDDHVDPCPEVIAYSAYGTVFRREMGDDVTC